MNWGDKVVKKMVFDQEVLESSSRGSSEGQLIQRYKEKKIVWYGASSIALGVMLEIGSVEVAWLRKEEDYNHINVARLYAVLTSNDLALR